MNEGGAGGRYCILHISFARVAIQDWLFNNDERVWRNETKKENRKSLPKIYIEINYEVLYQHTTGMNLWIIYVIM